MINGNPFGLAGRSGCEKQIAKVARHLVDWFQFARGEGNPIVYRATFAFRSPGERSSLFFLCSVQKQGNAGVADDCQISVNRVFRIQWDITGSAAPNCQKRGVGVNGVLRKNADAVSLSYSVGSEERAYCRTQAT